MIAPGLPQGPPVDPAPRPLPVRAPLAGGTVRLEPLGRRHAPDLWAAMHDGAPSWTYMPYGPFDTEAALLAWVDDQSSQHDPMFWAVRPVASGRVAGFAALMNIEPRNAAIELGHVWFGPALRRTRAATEAVAVLLGHAAGTLGYRRLVWKCDSLNAASRAAAERLGFQLEGVLRAHRVVRGRRRDTATFSITEDEWPACAAALGAWLDAGNFREDGTALRGLAAIRAELAQGA